MNTEMEKAQEQQAELLKPLQYPLLSCAYCGCRDTSRVIISEAWRETDKHQLFYPTISVGARGKCEKCGMKFEIILKPSQGIEEYD